MRPLCAAAFALSACWAPWSNDDPGYLSAIPERRELKTQLTQSLATGPPSPYVDIKNLSDNFNAFIDQVLGGLDFIREVPPTRREADARIWGPYPDDAHEGFEVLLEIRRETDALYSWAVKQRPLDGRFFTVAGGESMPRDARGSFFLDATAAHSGFGTMPKPDAGEPDRADFQYAAGGDPIIVAIDLQFPASKTLAYTFNGYADQSAVLAILFTGQVDATAGWSAETAGRLDYQSLEGPRVQCWDASHAVVYSQDHDDAGDIRRVGDPSRCYDPPDLKLP